MGGGDIESNNNKDGQILLRGRGGRLSDRNITRGTINNMRGRGKGGIALNHN